MRFLLLCLSFVSPRRKKTRQRKNNRKNTNKNMIYKVLFFQHKNVFIVSAGISVVCRSHFRQKIQSRRIRPRAVGTTPNRIRCALSSSANRYTNRFCFFPMWPSRSRIGSTRLLYLIHLSTLVLCEDDKKKKYQNKIRNTNWEKKSKKKIPVIKLFSRKRRFWFLTASKRFY